jgi:ABC-type transport system substrate-binding protein/class 3 adenylate cyclase
MSVSSGERRIVAALIADVAGSTSIGEQIGPERSKFLFDEIVGLMRHEIERFGGTVAQLTGDGVLALFGVPSAHGDDSERAVRAALAVQESLARYASQVASAYGVSLSARVAVNTGPVAVPKLDAPPDVLYNALGDTVNIAARLQGLGDIVVGPITARQVEAFFELEDLGAVEVKGKAQPVRAFRVIGVRDKPLERARTPLIGREAELTSLADAFTRLLDGTGAIVSITGEPGIGKSRLVAEASGLFEDRVRFLSGHAVAYAETIPYWPLREVLRDWLGLGESDADARVRLELRAALARTLDGRADDAYPYIATLVGAALEPGQEQRTRDLAADAVRQEFFHWAYELVVALARERPLCLVLDDLHWSDEATLTLLESLLPVVDEAGVGFVLIHRSDPDHAAWQLIDRARRRFRGAFSEIEPSPLQVDDARNLARDELDADVPPQLALLISERAGGNPYFITEALRDLRERGVLSRENGHVVVTGEVTIPDALQETLQARLDRVGAEARDLIHAGAVIGRSFGMPLLERVLPGARLSPALSELQWLQLIDVERSGVTPEYRFRHGLVRDAAYAKLLDPQRRDLHRRVADALLGLHADSVSEVYGLVAYHYAEADVPEKAVDYLLRAGDAARAAYANEEALAYYERALLFLDRLGDGERSRKTLFKIALTHYTAFDFHRANEAFSEAFARRAPTPMRLEPAERIKWLMPAAWDRIAAPGHSTSKPALEVAQNLFRGLVRIGRDHDIEPDLAERFSISDDGLSYRFTLREDALWSDGRPVTERDFVFTFDRMVADEVPMTDWMADLNASVAGARTLEIRLTSPRNDFLYMLAQPALFAWPSHTYEREGPDWHRLVPLVSSGPFVLTNRDDTHAVMSVSPTWSGARGNVAEVEIELESSLAAAAASWKRGEYDVLDSVMAKRAAVDDRTVLERSPGTWTWYLAFDAQRPPFDDRRVRLAVAHAVDRTDLALAIPAAPAATGGLIPPFVQGHSPRVAPAFDPVRARALLREAGLAEPGSIGEVVLACLELWEDTTAMVAASLREIGMPVRVLSLATDPDLAEAIRADAAHANVWAWGMDFPDAGRGILEPILADNPSLYRDEELESLLHRAVALRDHDERLQRYREYERRWIGEQAALVPLGYGDTALWLRPWVTGMWVAGSETSTFADAVVKRSNLAD